MNITREAVGEKLLLLLGDGVLYLRERLARLALAVDLRKHRKRPVVLAGHGKIAGRLGTRRISMVKRAAGTHSEPNISLQPS